MKFAFFAGSVVPFHANTLEERPLGGTETGIIRLSEALFARGHEVTVFTAFNNPPASNVRYLPLAAVEEHSKVDVFIAIRDWIPCLYKIPTALRMLWSGDSYDQFSNFGIGDVRVSDRIDALVTVSRWQAQTLSEHSGFPVAKTWVMGNGIHLPYFEGEEKRIRKRLVYSSTPHRGLVYVPELYKALKKKHPDLEIHIFSSYQVYDQERARNFEELRGQLSQLPDCHLYESVVQSRLAREFMKSSILFYPCDFEETSCITAMEAQAAGCVVLSSALAALPETVGDRGVLVPGRPSQSGYTQAYLEAADRLLSDDELFNRLSQKAKSYSPEFSWNRVAARLELSIKDRI